YADAPVVLEREPNDTPETAQEVELPAVICGRFDRPGDRDWYTFNAKAGEALSVDLLCERLDLPGDPLVIITGANGDEVATLRRPRPNLHRPGPVTPRPAGPLPPPGPRPLPPVRTGPLRQRRRPLPVRAAAGQGDARLLPGRIPRDAERAELPGRAPGGLGPL